jgi:hypothetical protein
MPLAVNEPGAELTRLAAPWPVVEPLMAGTRAMRAAGENLLPCWPGEDVAAYKARLAVATLFPAYRRTVTVMAGKPFAKPLTIGDAPDAALADWAPWLADIDRKGTSLHVFAAEMLAEGLAHGIAGIYVDWPRATEVPRAENGVTSKAAEKAAGLRPYFVRVLHGQLLGWRYGADGQLDMVRFREDAEVADGEYGAATVERVRVLYRGRWELHEKAGSTWGKVDEGTTPNVNVIPFVPVYGRRLGPMHGVPPLEDVAYLNVKHWQSQSDQDAIEHVARVPILTVRGVDAQTFQLAIGASTAINLGDNPGAELKFVEHTGAAISAGAAALERLEQQMIQSGAELLVKKPGQRTATESANDAEANKCDLQRIVEDFEDSLDQALVIAGLYARVQPPSVSLFKDFGSTSLSDASAQLVADLNARGLLSRETTLGELKRRGVLADTVSAEDEAERIASEPPPLGMAGDAVE